MSLLCLASEASNDVWDSSLFLSETVGVLLVGWLVGFFSHC